MTTQRTQWGVMVLLLAAACGSEEATQPAPPQPAPVTEPPAPPDPTLLPAVEPVADPISGADGFLIEVDAAHEIPSVTARNQGTLSFEGNIRFHVVWIGPPSGPEARPWRSVGAVPSCPMSDPPPAATATQTWGGHFGPGWTTSWDLQPDPGSYCSGAQIEGMPAPPGRYRISASFERQDGTVERVLWSQPFVRQGL